MKNPRLMLFAALCLLPSAASLAADVVPDPPHVCDPCAQWNEPREPFHVYGNTWFVGTGGLGSILITSPKGHILIDGGLPQSAPLIARNIETAGFKLADVKLILNSHTHYDHAGGIAALLRATHAQVAASPESKLALERGGPTEADPQFGFGAKDNDYAPVRPVRAIADGETLRVGDLAVTAHFTPGHTPGGTSWSWLECENKAGKKVCLHMVYADSLNSVSAPGFRFTGDAQHASRVESFEHSIDEVANLPCDILLAAHPVFVDLDAKLARWKQDPKVNPLIDTGACKAYAAGARARLDQRIAEERADHP
jgi:metallo-beta-lactamase class B